MAFDRTVPFFPLLQVGALVLVSGNRAESGTPNSQQDPQSGATTTRLSIDSDGNLVLPDGFEITGNLVMTGTLDMNGYELILDADADTSITADTDDQIDVKLNGVDHVVMKAVAAADAGVTRDLVEIAATSAVNTTGTNVLNALTIDLEIGNASGGTNTVRAIQIDGVTADAQVTDVAINVGSGWTSAFVYAGDAARSLVLGVGEDIILGHNGTHSLLTSATGNFTIDSTSATGAIIAMLGTDTTATKFAVQNNSAADLFSVTPSSATAGTALVAGVLDLNGTLDMDAALTGTGDAANIAATMTHASQVAEGLDVSIAQITNARTAGSLSAIRASVTSLTGSTAGTDHYAYEAAVTVGEATADHFVLKQGAGFDNTIDASSCATTEAGLLVAANVADAWHTGNGSLTYEVLKTTTATPGIDWTFALTGAESALHATTTANLASGAITGIHSQIATVTTNHTAGVIAAYKASYTSLAGDTGGDFVGLHLSSTDGGGATPFHSGVYCDTALDALIKVSADGMGGVVIGATMTISPEAAAESGYFRFNVGSTVYQVPIYAA